MAFVVNSVFANGVDLVLEKEFDSFALQVMKIHPLNQTLSMILQTFSPTLHNPSTRLTCASYVGMILTMVMIVYHGSRLSMVPHESFQCQPMNQNEFKPNHSGFDQPPHYSIIDQEWISKLNYEFMESMQSMFKEFRERHHAVNLSTHTSELSRRFSYIFYDDDDDEERTIPLCDIISQLPSTIPEKESDEFIKYSVEDLVPILSESEDTSGSDSECDLSSCDNFSPISIPEGKSVTFSNLIFDSNDDFTSSDDESLSDEDILEDNFKIYLNPLFKFDDEYISSNVNPLFDEVLEDIECKDSYDFNIDESTFLVTPLFNPNEDECFDPKGDTDEVDAFLDIDTSMDINDGYYDSKGDVIYLESLLTNDTIPSLPYEVFLDHDPKSLKDESDIDNLKYMVKVFNPEIHDKSFSPTYVSLPFEDRHCLFFTYVL
nr:hypothetical protein [Tanacetum cinerariifolium]